MGRKARRTLNPSSSRRRICNKPCSKRTSRRLRLARVRLVRPLRQQVRQRERLLLQPRRVKRRIVLRRRVQPLRLLRVKMKIAAGLRMRLLARHLMRRERSRPLPTANRIANGSRLRPNRTATNRTATNLPRVERTAPNPPAAPRVAVIGTGQHRVPTTFANPAQQAAAAIPALNSICGSPSRSRAGRQAMAAATAAAVRTARQAAVEVTPPVQAADIREAAVVEDITRPHDYSGGAGCITKPRPS